jgi:ADP-ribose pyrophosphatase YjhB (NUDIX family)
MAESLNPALDGVRFCPRCGRPADVDHPRSIACPSCGYRAYYNPKPVAAAIPFTVDGDIWLLRRGFKPGRGLWTFPGGFVDLGESVSDAARREAREELELELELNGLVGVYSRSEDRVVLIVFAAHARGTARPTPEAPEVRAFAPDAIPFDELAFWSTGAALRDALGKSGDAGLTR